MLGHFKVSTRLYLVSFCAIGFIVISSGMGLWVASSSKKTIQDVVKVSAKSVDLAQRARANMMMLRRYEKDAFLNIASPDKVSEYAKKRQDGHDLVNKNLNDLEKLVGGQKGGDAVVGKIASIVKNLEGYSVGFNAVLVDIQSGKITTPSAANESLSVVKNEIHQSDTDMQELAANIDKQMQAQEVATEKKLHSFILVLSAITFVAIVFPAIFMFFVARSILQPLKMFNNAIRDVSQGDGDLTYRFNLDTRDELGEMAGHLNEAWEKLDKLIAKIVENAVLVEASAGSLSIEARRILHGTRQMNTQATAVATASEEMAATSNDIARNCAIAADNSQVAANVAEGGKETVGKTISRVGSLRSEIENSSQVISSLGDNSEKIGNIASTIQDIADQINLSALNAAIEAARAGEHGRGFAVIADEVRALAERTAKATKEISDMIRSIQSETGHAVAVMERSGKEVDAGVCEANDSGLALERIIEQVEGVATQINQIATAAEEQTATTVEIVGNIGKISDFVGNFEKSTHIMNEKVEHLKETAEHLKNNAMVFKCNVSPLMILDTAKSDHVNFVTRIERCLDGHESVQANTLPDHRNCRFGKWYFSDGQKVCGSSHSFRVIDAPHEKIHRLAKEAVDLYNRGEVVLAEERLAEVEDLSHEVVALLEKVKQETR